MEWDGIAWRSGNFLVFFEGLDETGEKDRGAP